MNFPIAEPIITRAKKYDGLGYWRDYLDIEHRKDWVIDFTPTYAKTKHNSHIFNRSKVRLTWFFKGYEPKHGGIVRKKLLIRAAKEEIVHLYIHRTLPPMADEEIRYLQEYNERLDLEREKIKNKAT